MKTTSTVKPISNYEIVVENEKSTVRLYENITEKQVTDEQGTHTEFEWDMYVIEVRSRDNLEESIRNNFQMWLDFAKQKEFDDEAEKVRAKRDELLAESDPIMCIDRLNLRMPESDQFADWLPYFQQVGVHLTGVWARYRQALRDVPQQEGFPFNVEWPKKPGQ